MHADSSEVTCVEATVAKEGFRRSSTAVYRLRVKVRDLERLPSIIGLIPEVKQVELDGIEWGYDSLRDLRLEMLATCLDESRKKAALVAERLDQRLGGVHRFSEKLEDRGEHLRGLGNSMMLELRGAALGPEGTAPPHIELSHTRRVTLRATVSYLVSPRT